MIPHGNDQRPAQRWNARHRAAQGRNASMRVRIAESRGRRGGLLANECTEGRANDPAIARSSDGGVRCPRDWPSDRRAEPLGARRWVVGAFPQHWDFLGARPRSAADLRLRSPFGPPVGFQDSRFARPSERASKRPAEPAKHWCSSCGPVGNRFDPSWPVDHCFDAHFGRRTQVCPGN